MPTQAESLTPQSTPEATQSAISSCIAQLMDEGGRPQEQCIAICYSQAEKAIGRNIPRKSTRIGK